MASGFVDEARINAHAGDGGAGSPSFAREKYRPKGGPDGGDGGHGGSVVVAADGRLETLAELRLRRNFRAKPGGIGKGKRSRGADAPDVVIPVPLGTIVRDASTGEVLADLATEGARYIVAKGGRGGRGNAVLSGPQDRAPNFAERGELGEERAVALDLRILADAGLLGPPNAGKSTLLRAISAAQPKVGDYPFTTLEPHLGVVESGHRYVAADLPGLIEGASEGRGLGTRFLRHAERCAVLVLVVDMTSSDPASELEAVSGEVTAYDPELAGRIRFVVANKSDLQGADPAPAREWARRRGLPFFSVSALEQTGTGEVAEALGDEVARVRAERPVAESFAVFRPVVADKVVVEREGAGFRVTSSRAEKAVQSVPPTTPRATRHLQRRLASIGVESALVRAGVQEGDEVYIGEITFEYSPEPPKPVRRRRG